MSGLTAPLSSGSKRTRRSDVELLAPGYHLCRLYGIVDIGDQLNTKYGTYNRKVKLLFEFPYMLQFFYEEDTERKPTMVSCEFTLSFHQKSSLRPFVDNMLGSRMSDAQAESFDLFSLVDKYYVANIVHQASRTNDRIYENINSITKYDARFLDTSKELVKHNDTMLYSIDEHGFMGENWLRLYFYLRNSIKESKQGIDHIAAGGTFEEPNYDDNNQAQSQRQQQAPRQQQPIQSVQAQPQQASPQQQVTSPQVAAQAGQKPQVRMLGNVPLQAYLDKGWTIEQLVAHGQAEYVKAEVSAPPVQAPSVPGPPIGQPASANAGQPAFQQLQGSGQPVTQPKIVAPQNMQHVAGDNPDDDLPF